MIEAIVNGDDFGLAPAINDGILLAHDRGCFTSASLCVVGPAAVDAARRALIRPRLAVGLHLTLVEERPVLPAEQVPSLVDDTGCFLAGGRSFACAWLAGRISPDDVRRELRAQPQRMVDLGLQPTHVDAHDHVHVLPGVLEIVLDEIGSAGISCVRVPLERTPHGRAPWQRRLSGWVLYALAWRAHRIVRQRGFSAPDQVSGFRGAGNIDARSLAERINALQNGVTEIIMHPATGPEAPRRDLAAWGYRWADELDACLDEHVRGCLRRRQVALISYRDLASRSSPT